MTLHQIIKSLQSASGSNAKQAIMTEHKGNELFKEFMRITYDPAINFWQSSVPKSADWDTTGTSGMNIEWLAMLVDNLANRKVTGAQAKIYLGWYNHVMNTEHRELLKLIIDRSIGASVGSAMVLKTWPKLFFTVPYARCSLLDSKAKERFSKLPLMYVQPKLDGSFLYLVTSESGKESKAITRAGSVYPKWFSDYLAERVPADTVFIGECLVYEDKVLLNRQTGNGILNSIMKGGECKDNLSFKMIAWDLITVQEFLNGKSPCEYFDRLVSLQYTLDYEAIPAIEAVPNYAVHTMEEAYKIYSDHTARGEEGCVLKNPNTIWKDGTSKDMVKMKISFEIDLEVEEIVEGSGKYVGMMGAVKLKSRCGKLRTDVGTGFCDQQRKDIFEFGLPKIVTIKANDIIGKRGSDTFSCFLPVFLEARLDKTVADTYDECVAQLQAAKGIA